MNANPFKVVCLGDSLTGPRPDVRYLDKYVKWPDLLQLALEAELGNGRALVVNRGHAGDSSAKALARLEEQVLTQHPDVVVVLIGGNNFGSQHDPVEQAAKLREDLTAIVNKLKSASIRVLLLQYPEPRAENMEQVWVHLDDGNPVIAEVARQLEVPTLELAPAFREASCDRPLAELASAKDGVHLNPYGEVTLAKAVFFKLKDLNWLPVSPP